MIFYLQIAHMIILNPVKIGRNKIISCLSTFHANHILQWLYDTFTYTKLTCLNVTDLCFLMVCSEGFLWSNICMQYQLSQSLLLKGPRIWPYGVPRSSRWWPYCHLWYEIWQFNGHKCGLEEWSWEHLILDFAFVFLKEHWFSSRM